MGCKRSTTALGSCEYDFYGETAGKLQNTGSGDLLHFCIVRAARKQIWKRPIEDSTTAMPEMNTGHA